MRSPPGRTTCSVLDLQLDPQLVVTEVALPDWVATIGGAAMRT